jgi:hypothetical protein
LVLKILSFNVGVEVGQIVGLSIMLLVLGVWRKRDSFKQFSKACNVALMMAGGLLMLMQLHGYQHTQYADDFPLNQDDHHHLHEDMAAQISPLSTYKKTLDLELDINDTIPLSIQQTREHSHNGDDSDTH